MEPCKPLKEVQWVLQNLGIIQAANVLEFEGLYWITFTSGMNAKLLQSAPGTWYGVLISTVNSVVG